MTELDTTGVIDAHLHFWDPGTLRYPWLDGLSINRPYLPPDAARSVGGHQVSGLVFVQADCRPSQSRAEVDWVLAQGKGADAPRISGIVAYADLTSADVVDHLDALSSIESVVGVRQNIQDREPGFSLSLLAGVEATAEAGLTFDLCCKQHQLDEVIELVESANDNVRFVLDHLGKPLVGDEESFAGWSNRIQTLADAPNTTCKLSGLMTEVMPDVTADYDAIAPYLTHALETFGPDRVLYGSDWPVCTLAGTTEIWASIVARSIGSDSRLHDRVFYQNAVETYRLTPPHPLNPKPDFP